MINIRDRAIDGSNFNNFVSSSLNFSAAYDAK